MPPVLVGMWPEKVPEHREVRHDRNDVERRQLIRDVDHSVRVFNGVR